MSYKYNTKAHYAPYGRHQELITGEDLNQLEIVVRDYKDRRQSFSIKVPDFVLDLGVYKYLKHDDFYNHDGYQTAKSAYNFYNTTP